MTEKKKINFVLRSCARIDAWMIKKEKQTGFPFPFLPQLIVAFTAIITYLFIFILPNMDFGNPLRFGGS